MLVRNACDLAKHLQSVRVHHSDTSKSRTLLEGLEEKRLGGFKLDLGGFILRKVRWVLDLLIASLLGLLPQDLGHLARDLGGTGEDERTVSNLEDARVFLDGDHGGEFLDRLEHALLLQEDNVTRVDLLILANTLDGQTNGVSWSSALKLLLVLLDGENLLSCKAGGHNADNVSGAEGTLLDGTADNLTDTLNVVDTGDGESKGSVRESLRWHDEVVQCLDKREALNDFLGTLVSLPALVPGGLVGLLDEIVAVKARIRDEGDLLGLEANGLKHLDEFVLDFIETILGPVTGVHLVDANDDLLNTEKVEETGVLTGLAFFDAELRVGLGNSGFEATLLSRDQKETDISGGGSGDHVLDVILVTRSIDDGVVVLVSEELLGVALDGDTTFALFLARIKVVGKAKGRFALFFRHGL